MQAINTSGDSRQMTVWTDTVRIETDRGTIKQTPKRDGQIFTRTDGRTKLRNKRTRVDPNFPFTVVSIV